MGGRIGSQVGWQGRDVGRHGETPRRDRGRGPTGGAWPRRDLQDRRRGGTVGRDGAGTTGVTRAAIVPGRAHHRQVFRPRRASRPARLGRVRSDRLPAWSLVGVRGRSMLPTLREGDVLLVRGGRAAARRARAGRLAVVRLPGGRPLGVKRLAVRDGAAWWVERDNPLQGVDSWQLGATGSGRRRSRGRRDADLAPAVPAVDGAPAADVQPCDTGAGRVA